MYEEEISSQIGLPTIPISTWLPESAWHIPCTGFKWNCLRI